MAIFANFHFLRNLCVEDVQVPHFGVIRKYVAHNNLTARVAAAADAAVAALVTATTDVGSGQTCFVAVNK